MTFQCELLKQSLKIYLKTPKVAVNCKRYAEIV